jgi:diguanylate cyclase (GGDEF)-like protein
MEQKLKSHTSSVFEEEELRGFSRSMAELQWLLLILAVLYFFIPTSPIHDTDALIVIMVCYATFIMAFRYLNFHARETRWKLAMETWAMISFITLVIWHTGQADSPLLNLYLLVIIACAITLGKIMTMLEVALIACCYLYMGYASYSTAIFVPATFTTLMAKFSPFLLVAYVTSMLASDILNAKKKITILSQTDELTGLLNMRAFNTILEREIASATRYRQPFSIVMLDVDGLKEVNDRFGHPAGSQLVSVIADAIRNSVRGSDVVARYGGDEFIVLLTHTSADYAVHAAERIRSAIDNTSFDMDGNRISSTVSIGIACFPDCVTAAKQVLDKADVALYKSKNAGRNRVTCYEEVLDLSRACA